MSKKSDSLNDVPLNSVQVRRSLQRVAVGDVPAITKIAQVLGQTIFGQDEALQVVARRIAMAEAGLTDQKRPLGSFLFLGPTGVGKTETARALAKYMFGQPDSNRLKMLTGADFADAHSVYRLLGSPPGYVGYGDELLLTPAWLAKGRAIVLLDELEKAHPKVWEFFLSVMEEGKVDVQMGSGQYQNVEQVPLLFNNAIIIMTSNIGAEEIWTTQKTKKTAIGFFGEVTPATVTEVAMAALEEVFKFMPEFLGRIDRVVVFNPLGRQELERIFWKILRQINSERIFAGKGNFFLTATAECVDSILRRLNSNFGARDLRHLVDEMVLAPLADALLCYGKEYRVFVADADADEIALFTGTMEVAQSTAVGNMRPITKSTKGLV